MPDRGPVDCVGEILELNCRLKLFGVVVWKLLYVDVWMFFSESGDDAIDPVSTDAFRPRLHISA